MRSRSGQTPRVISVRARFALHGLCYLAKSPAGETTSFPRLFALLQGYSGDLALSRTYVAKVFQDLSRAGLVRAVPGRKGGYRLARQAGEVTVLDVVGAMDRAPSGDCCLLADGSCPVKESCGVGSVLERAEKAFFGVLGKQTIESLARKMALPLPARTAARRPARRR